MALYEKLPVDFSFCDERGQLTQVVHKGYEQINILESKKGIVRGGHYHKISSEAFYVIDGVVRVTFTRGEEKEIAQFQKKDFFLIRPYVAHSMFFLEDCILLALYDISVEKEDGTKDIYAEEIQR